MTATEGGFVRRERSPRHPPARLRQKFLSASHSEL